MSSVQKLVTDEDVFPTKYGTSLPCCTPPYWAAVAAYGKGPDLWDRDSCVTWTVKPGRCALAGVSLATPGSGTWSLCHPAPPPVPWGCCSPSHWGPDSQQAVATLHPDLAGGGLQANTELTGGGTWPAGGTRTPWFPSFSVAQAM